MQRLEVSGAVRLIYMSLGVKCLINISFDIPILKLAMWQHVVLCVLSFESA